MSIKIVVAKTTKSSCSFCNCAMVVKVIENEDTKKVCNYHKGFMPENVQEAIEAALMGGKVVA